MVRIKVIILLILTVGISSCYESDPIDGIDEKDENMDLNGRIYLEEEPIQGMFVQIDTNPAWRDSTNEYGAFEVKDLTFGAHHFVASKNFDDGTSVYVNKTVQMDYDGVYMNEIIFPAFPVLYAPQKAETVERGLKISWGKAADKDFIKYEVFKSGNQNLDNTTGIKIGTIENVQDTSVTDVNIEENITYYYRVYLYTSNGRQCGGKVISGIYN